MKIVNLTGHEVDVLFCGKLEDDECPYSSNTRECEECNLGRITTIHPKDFSMSATPVQKVVRKRGRIKFATLNWKPNFECEKKFEEIKDEYVDEAIFIGSIIAAQAFPEEVCAMVPVPGYERVPRDEKIVRSDMFTIFEKEGDE